MSCNTISPENYTAMPYHFTFCCLEVTRQWCMVAFFTHATNFQRMDTHSCVFCYA